MLTKILLAVTLAASVVFTGCAATVSGSTPTAAETQANYNAALLKATLVVDQVTVTANTAYKAGVLKQGDAENVLTAVKAARDGLNLAKTMEPAQGLSKTNMTMAILGGTQIYLATLGVK